MNFKKMQNLMKKAVPLAKEMEGDWQARMKLSVRIVKADYYMQQPISKEIIQKLLLHNVSYRRICKNYDMSRKEISAFENM
ncbi:hypothetical protein WV34_03515 [Bacillus amyloliquefaciens]|uniref:hypothetical protein n=1 Tax=Bacillaceae TaxID=186817 RepID=UPI000B518163|nr:MULTISPECIES: hypothetical protein [Bacillus amyloliquefaciens group]ASF27892.1 hypothetical protein WV34_03515 [Bacillus amyloliquefaciens]